MMDCTKFQDTITDYLEGALMTGERAEFAAHRLRCRDCREMFSDVRMAVESLDEYAAVDYLGESAALENRILAATSAGDMLSCRDFDRLLERYFDGVILAPTFQHFQDHFKTCRNCRRLMAGIDDAIELFTEARESEIEMPAALNDKILSATIGSAAMTEQAVGLRARLMHFISPLLTPQWAATALIFAAGTLFVHSRFGGFDGMASEAGTKAGQLVVQGNEAVTQTGAIAVTGMQLVSSGFNRVLNERKSNARPRKVDTEFSPHEAELFDLRPQPPEKENLAADSTHQEKKKK